MRIARRVKESKYILAVVLAIGLSNFQPHIKSLFVFIVEPFFTSLDYATASGKFQDEEMPLKHRTYESVIIRFNQHKLEYPKDSVLYRLYRINPLLFWRWSDFISAPRYKLPYLSPDKVPSQISH